jgi:hypothetical protein
MRVVARDGLARCRYHGMDGMGRWVDEFRTHLFCTGVALDGLRAT